MFQGRVSICTEIDWISIDYTTHCQKHPHFLPYKKSLTVYFHYTFWFLLDLLSLETVLTRSHYLKPATLLSAQASIPLSEMGFLLWALPLTVAGMTPWDGCFDKIPHRTLVGSSIVIKEDISLSRCQTACLEMAGDRCRFSVLQ